MYRKHFNINQIRIVTILQSATIYCHLLLLSISLYLPSMIDGKYLDSEPDDQQQQQQQHHHSHQQQQQTVAQQQQQNIPSHLQHQKVIFKPLQLNDYHAKQLLKQTIDAQYSNNNNNIDQYAKPSDEYIKVTEDYDKESIKHDDKHSYTHQPYGFGYNIEDGYGNKQWRHEKSSNPHQVIGSYGYKDKNGILREVEYVADKYGFRAVIKTTEPGTANSDPAYVKMNSNPISAEYYSANGATEGYSSTPVKTKELPNYQEQALVAAGYKQHQSSPTLYHNEPNAQEPTFLVASYGAGADNGHKPNGPTVSLGPYEGNDYLVGPESNHIHQTSDKH
ncbi:uncharacterized protein LOC113789884 [Dermatophagoides pteronyssinus]|uniref:uncharacterized protein LOC113789884 n=1 Tax=Dermatophagoides pteronyssinus TaxID=6956 RepID=UPI003F67B83E